MEKLTRAEKEDRLAGFGETELGRGTPESKNFKLILEFAEGNRKRALALLGYRTRGWGFQKHDYPEWAGENQDYERSLREKN